MSDKRSFDILLGKYLRLKRNQQLKTQDDIAHKANMTSQHLGTIERGEKSPNLYTFFKLWIALDFNVNDLFKYIKEEMRL